MKFLKVILYTSAFVSSLAMVHIFGTIIYKEYICIGEPNLYILWTEFVVAVLFFVNVFYQFLNECSH